MFGPATSPEPPVDPPAQGTAAGATTEAEALPSRPKQLAVRGGHLGMVILVAVAVAGPLALPSTPAVSRSLPADLTLVLAALLYIGWNLLGTRSLVPLIISEHQQLAGIEARRPVFHPAVFFLVQLALAATVHALGDRGRIPSLVWLALLPPVAYAVFFLRGRGITLVTLACVAVLLAVTLRWHGWRGVAYALPAFLVAVVFTLVFTLLVVGAETARHQAQSLAEELRAANDRLRHQAVEMEDLAATRERNRLAREIHDSLGHYLTVIHVQLQAALALADSRPDQSRDAVAKARTLTAEGLREIRGSVAALRASPLDNRQLADALREILDQHQGTGLEGTFTVEGIERPLAPATALALYRAGQEALTNVRKHARAHHVHLALDFRASDRVLLRSMDDGIGPATPDSPADPASGPGAGAGFGLLGLQERIQLLGGTLTTSGTPGGGFHLCVEVPG